MLQAAAAFARAGASAIYVSGEEAGAQLRMRAQRLGLEDAPVRLGTDTALRDILTTLDAERPDVAVIDSIQTLWSDTVDAAPGSVSQVRAAAHELTTFAKRTGVAVILVGHVTKDGQIAGPRVVEHMVDTVLYFEGERGHQFRILRAVKNRFGPSGEIGVFEMTGGGTGRSHQPLGAVSVRTRPAGRRIGRVCGDRGHAPGSDGNPGAGRARPPLPRRVAPWSGWTAAGSAPSLPCWRRAARVPFAGLDVFLNVAGGMRVLEPAADLAIAAALLSAREDHPLPAEAVLFGEISLSGALRPVAQAENRLKEARKLGFSHAIVPAGQKAGDATDMRLDRMSDLTGFVGEAFGAG